MTDLAVDTGNVVDRYRIEEVIGHGATARVLRVKHLHLGSVHALKVLTIFGSGIRERLMQEGQAQAQLRHPNVVSVTDVIDLDGNPALVMEYIDGPSLDQLLGQHRLTLDQTHEIALGILHGVAAAHEAGLVHRDLKPANVLLDKSPTGLLIPKVADFGLVKLIASDGMSASRTATGATMGTPAYMAPEQFQDSASVDLRADIFSLGAILYELVTGQRCFNGRTVLDTLTAVASGEYEPVTKHAPGLPPHMVRAIEGCLMVEPEQRIQDVPTLMKLWLGVKETHDAPPARWDGAMLAKVRRVSLDGDTSHTGETGSEFTFAMPLEPPPGGYPSQYEALAKAKAKAAGQTSDAEPSPTEEPRRYGWALPIGVATLMAAAASVSAAAVAVLMLGGGEAPVLVGSATGAGAAVLAQASPAEAPEGTADPRPTTVEAPPVAEPDSVAPELEEAEPSVVEAAPAAAVRVAPRAVEPVAVQKQQTSPPPAPVAKVTKDAAKVEVSGDVEDLWLVSDSGRFRASDPSIPPGDYTLHAFFDGEPVKMGALALAAGEHRQVRCSGSMLVCR